MSTTTAGARPSGPSTATILAAYGGLARPSMDTEPRCDNCGRRLAEYLSRPYALACPRCKHRCEAL